MVDSVVAEDAVDAAPAPSGLLRRRRKPILAVAALLFGLLAVGAILYFTGLGSFIGLGSTGRETDKAAGAPAFFSLPDMLVNIDAGSGRQGFLKLSVTLEVADAETIPQIRAVLPRVIDNFQTYLRELRIEDLAGAAGLYRLREELLVRVNAAIAPAKVTDVLFKQMLVQQ